MNPIEQIFENLKAELVSLVGDLTGVHNLVDDAKAAIAPHVVPYGSKVEPVTPEESTEETKNDLGNNNKNEGESPNAP